MRLSFSGAAVVLMATALVSSIACGGSPTSPSLDSVSITLTGTGVTSYTYTANIASIMADCTSIGISIHTGPGRPLLAMLTAFSSSYRIILGCVK